MHRYTRYDRYWTGRTAWSDVIRTSRTLSRLIWFHVPLRLVPETKDVKKDEDDKETQVESNKTAENAKRVMIEKRMALDLVEA
jgi:putative membrane protein